jgi:hypothetical protein
VLVEPTESTEHRKAAAKAMHNPTQEGWCGLSGYERRKRLLERDLASRLLGVGDGTKMTACMHAEKSLLASFVAEVAAAEQSNMFRGIG